MSHLFSQCVFGIHLYWIYMEMVCCWGSCRADLAKLSHEQCWVCSEKKRKYAVLQKLGEKSEKCERNSTAVPRSMQTLGMRCSWHRAESPCIPGKIHGGAGCPAAHRHHVKQISMCSPWCCSECDQKESHPGYPVGAGPGPEL